MNNLSRRAVLLGALGVAGASLVGCTSDQDPSEPPSESPTPESPTPSKDTRPRAPLTGALVTNAAALKHAAVAIKVPNLRFEYPQIGLNEADIVFCQPNGDAYTRFCAVYHSKFPKNVNPVRSMRPVDVPLLAPMRPVFGNTGAADWVEKYVAANSKYLESLPFMSVQGTGAYTIDRKRVYTVNGRREFDRAVVAHPEVLRKLAKRMKAPPAMYLPFATGTDKVSTESGKAAKTIAIPYSRGNTYDMSYSYDAQNKLYLRSEPWGPQIMQDGQRVTADNVLIIRARWYMGKIFPGGGAADPVVEIVDKKGSFFYFHGGKYVVGVWSKGGVAEPFKFTCQDGSPLKIAPGRTWIELPQLGADIRTT